MSITKTLICLVGTVAALAACGGSGDSSPSPSPAPTPATAPGGLYVGYYQEDPTNNPEDPVPGAFSLNLPDSNTAFSGSMYFTYIGCQSSNVGTVSGTKTSSGLSGQWSGTVDGSAQSGAYTGTYDTGTVSYAGTYTNAGGKQFRDLSPCIQYTIAANGTWEMFAIDAKVPAGFSVSTSGRTVSWGSVTSAASALVYVLDPVIAQSTGNPVVWQTVLGTGTSVAVPAGVTLQSGKQYIAVVGVANSAYQRIAFGSTRFSAP